MREQDFHKLIRENSSKDNRALAEALRNKHPEIVHNSDSNKEARVKKQTRRRIAIFAPLAAAAVLIVVLVPALLLSKTGTDSTGNSDHGHASYEYTTEQLNCTVREYNDLNNTAFLYFDFVSVADYTVTRYNNKKTNAFWGLNVSLCNTETNDSIQYTICADDKPPEFIKYNFSVCTNEHAVAESAVKWSSANGDVYGIFNWDNYNYYLTLKNNNETRLFELVEVLLSSKK